MMLGLLAGRGNQDSRIGMGKAQLPRQGLPGITLAVRSELDIMKPKNKIAMCSSGLGIIFAS
jgi:hypothetical protein